MNYDEAPVLAHGFLHYVRLFDHWTTYSSGSGEAELGV
jgi:hypothetical protein